MRFLVYTLPLAAFLSLGCGGSARVSGPNRNTRQGLGTLRVNVTQANGSRVADDSATVSINQGQGQGIGVVRAGRAIFNDLTPGRYFVQARSQSIGLPGGSRSVDIQADKTVTITLRLSSFPASATPTPSTPFGGQ